jgi:DNA polymerase I
MEKAVWDLKSQFTSDASFDCLIAEFLLSDGRFVHGQEEILKKYDVQTLEELAEKQKKRLLELPKLQELFATIEMPLIKVLWQMEQTGILLDTKKLQNVGGVLEAAIIESEETIKKEVGFAINLNSSIQVGNYLVEKAGVPLAKTKTGRYATNETELAQYAEQFEIIEKILKYRELTKLRSTYVESLISKVDEKGRVHTNYNQVAASTGRLASSNPNLQNIPVTSEFGQKIKSCFIPTPGNVFLSFDYSQQELRILAHLTSEEKLIEAFTKQQDVHRTTASQLFDVSYDAVTKEQRNIAKTINFGIIYGMGSFGMSQGLRIPVEEAKLFIDTFYATYPKIKTFFDKYISQGKIDGFVETILGRRRYVFEDQSPSFAKASGGQGKFIDNNMRRVLLNYPIQGSAAEFMKKAMIEIHEKVVTKDPEVRLLLQIHDDLVFEMPDNQKKIDEVVDKVKEIMCNVYPLSVPVEVDVKRGNSWGEMVEI